jgi:transcription termination factor Rho
LPRSAAGSLAGHSLRTLRAPSEEVSSPLHFDQRPPQNGRPEAHAGGGGRRRRSRRGRQRFENPAQAGADIYAQPEFPQPVGPPQLSAQQLADMSKTELNELAKTFDIATPVKVKKDDLVAQILEIQAQRSGLEVASGVLDILPEGYGFLRRAGFLAGTDDIYISQSQIRRFELRRGDLVAGQVRKPKDNEKYYGIVKVESVNGLDPEAIRERANFDELTPVHATESYVLERKGVMTARAIDLFAPIGKGQRVLVAAPPKTGKTTLLKELAASFAANHPETHVIALLVDERPEDVTAFERSVAGDVVATTFEDPVDHHVAVAELVLERAKRLVEVGRDVVILLDSLGRLARAFAGAHATPGRPPNGPADALAALKPKRYFGAARKTEEGGSLTIVATLTSDGGAKLDEVMLDELRGIANSEIVFLRPLADARVYPAFDLRRTTSQHEEALLEETVVRKIAQLRRAAIDRSAFAFTELVLERLAKSKSNADFLSAITDKSLAALAP